MWPERRPARLLSRAAWRVTALLPSRGLGADGVFGHYGIRGSSNPCARRAPTQDENGLGNGCSPNSHDSTYLPIYFLSSNVNRLPNMALQRRALRTRRRLGSDLLKREIREVGPFLRVLDRDG